MKTKATLFLAALAAIAAGCSSDDATQTPTDITTGAPVTVNVGVGSMETRTGHSSSELPDKFILNFAETAEGGNTYTDVTMTLDEATGLYQPSVPMTWGTDSRTATVRAWTEPVAVSEGTDYPIVSVAADQSTEENIRRSDFLCASTELGNNVTVSGDALDITFQHVFSKIDIRCHLGEELTSLYPYARVSKVVIGGVYRGGPFNFEYGTPVYNNESLTDQGPVTAYLNEPEAETGDVTAEAIIVPQNFTYDLQTSTEPYTHATLTITLINNNNVEQTMTAVPITTGSFESGKRYTMTVNIGHDSVTAGDITAQPWTEGSSWTIETE